MVQGIRRNFWARQIGRCEGSKRFFFGKKEPKNFCLRRALAMFVSQPAVNQSFFASFCSQKEVLSYRQLRISAHDD
jgi:hypothetical protein